MSMSFDPFSEFDRLASALNARTAPKAMRLIAFESVDTA